MTDPGIDPQIGVTFRLSRNQMLCLGILQVEFSLDNLQGGVSDSYDSNSDGRAVLSLSEHLLWRG